MVENDRIIMDDLITLVKNELFNKNKKVNADNVLKVLRHCDVGIYEAMDKATQQIESEQEKAKSIIQDAIDDTKV
jgi:hypothetical protein